MSVKTPVKGAASGFSLFDSFTPLERLTMTAQIDRYGRNFLTAREDSQFNAQSTRRLNVAVRPFKQMSFFGGVNDRVFLLGDSKPLRGYSYVAGAPLPLTRSVQLSFFRSVQNDLSASQGSFDMTQYSAAVMGIRGYSATVIYSRTRFGGAPAGNLSFAANKDYGSRGRFSVHDQIQPGTTHRYGVEWQIDLAAGSFRAGLDRMTNRRSRAAGFFPLLSVGLKLPGGQRLYLSYSGDKTTKTLSLVVSGSAIKRHEIERYTDGRFAAASAALAGRVYYDSDNDGAFSETADKPIAEVPVWIDDRISVQTDSHGFFRFSDLEPGAHSIRADLAGVPADLVFAQEAERIVAALPNRTTTQNFRVVRTGAVAAHVTFMDYSSDPENPVEQSLPDARVIADADHDSYSDLNGNLILGSLPPGTYQLRLDPATLPDGYRPISESIPIQVMPGETLRGVTFRLVIPPKPVIRKELP